MNRSPRIGQWRKHKLFECPFCAYATLDEARIWEHLDGHRKVITIQPDPLPKPGLKKLAIKQEPVAEEVSDAQAIPE